MDWLEANQDKSLEDINASATPAAKNDDDDPNAEPPALNPGEEAKSLECEECGKRFRSTAQAEFHATRSGHVDFKQSTEEIAPLTEEEKKAKLQAMREALAEKRAGMSEQDKIDKKKNEVSHTYQYICNFIWLLLLHCFKYFDATAGASRAVFKSARLSVDSFAAGALSFLLSAAFEFALSLQGAK